MNQDNLTTTISPISFGDHPSFSIANNQQVENQLEEAVKYKKQLVKLKRKHKQAVEESSNLQKQASALKIEGDRLRAQLNSLREDNQMLQLQLEAGHASHVESETAWTSLKAQNGQLHLANTSLLKQIENQRNELAKYSKERQSIVILVKNLHNALCLSEANYSKLLDENNELKKRKPTKLFENDTIDFNSVTFNYDDPNLTQLFTQIIRSPQPTPVQKVQAIVNETSKALNAKNEELDKLENELKKLKEQNEKDNENWKKSNEMYTMIFNELKQVEISAHSFDGRLFCDMDQAFLSFMAKYALDFDFIRKNSPISYELFSEETRAQILSKYDGITQKLFAAVFIINAELKRQLATAKRALLKQESFTELMKMLNCNTPEELPNIFTKFFKKIEKLQNAKKSLSKTIKEARVNSKKAEEEIEVLCSQVDNLKSANSKLKTKLQTLIAQWNGKSSSYSKVSSTSLSGSEIINHSQEEKYKEEIDNLNSLLHQRDSQIQQLMTSNEALNNENSKNLDTIAKLNNKLDTIQQAYQQLKMQQLSDQEKSKRKIRNLRNEYDRELAESNNRFEEIQRSMASSTSDCHRKIDQLNALAKRLSTSLSESEKRNRELCNDNSRLKIAVQSLQMKVASDEDKMKQEIQASEARAMAQILATETKLHESHNTEKAKIIGQKQSLIGFVADELGTFYGIHSSELDDEGFKELIMKVKSDLKKSNFSSF